MATVYSPNVIEIAVNQTYNGRPVVNVWHMWFDPEAGTDTIEAVVTDFRDNWQDHITSFQATSLTINGFEWRSLDTTDSSLGTLEVNGAKPTAGVVGAEGMPPNVAWLIRKNTEARPRGRRDGRAFVAGVPEAWANAAGVVDSTTQGTINTALAAFYNGISDTSGAPSGDRYPVVLETTPASRAPGTAPVTISSRRVTSIDVDDLLATQRDRLR